MRQHHYQVTVTELDDAGGTPLASRDLRFNARCHDDMLAIVERVRARHFLPAQDAAAMAIGLKLLGEIVIENRRDPLFQQVCRDLGSFIQLLKQNLKTGDDGSA